MTTGGLTTGVHGMSAAVADFRAATAAGFSISPSGGQALLSAISEILASVQLVLAERSVLEQEPPIGTTPAARVYRPFFASIATDRDQGFFAALERLISDLRSLADDVQQAMNAYQATDEDRAQNLKSTGGSVLSA
ncbi:hypothetical protein [Saccharothrix obliqua]|uniref:hypothetical protein n=1 Tax=Saccharothrix obliqua TaxID=2861747 RepID=UPI001C5EBB2F|nr:hypothetical protein [Saccharothrix obliqua]MBW4716386.1 hypothetical protein [Saccharothrix obliqua]